MTKGACELKSAQFSLMRLAIYQTDANAIQNFVADQVSAAPELLEGAPVALDFGTSARAADAECVEDIVARLHGAIDATLREPAIVEQMKKMTMVVEYMDQRSYQNFYTGEFDRWGQYIRTAKVTVDQ